MIDVMISNISRIFKINFMCLVLLLFIGCTNNHRLHNNSSNIKVKINNLTKYPYIAPILRHEILAVNELSKLNLEVLDYFYKKTSLSLNSMDEGQIYKHEAIIVYKVKGLIDSEQIAKSSKINTEDYNDLIAVEIADDEIELDLIANCADKIVDKIILAKQIKKARSKKNKK